MQPSERADSALEQFERSATTWPDQGEPAAPSRALDAVGVDFSIPEPDLLDFLGNAEFAPYPALSAGLLKLLENRMPHPPFSSTSLFRRQTLAVSRHRAGSRSGKSS